MDDVNVIRAEADIHYGSARPGGLVGMAFAFAPAAALACGARGGETNAEQQRDNPVILRVYSPTISRASGKGPSAAGRILLPGIISPRRRITCILADLLAPRPDDVIAEDKIFQGLKLPLGKIMPIEKMFE